MARIEECCGEYYINFGKYSGERFSSVPQDYLEFMCRDIMTDATHIDEDLFLFFTLAQERGVQTCLEDCW